MKLLTKDARDIIKIYGATKTIHNQNCMKFIYENNKIYMPISIDNKYDTVLFDSGSNSYLDYLEFNDTIPQNTKVMSISAINNKVKLHYTYKTVNIENELFTGYDCMQKTIFILYPKLICTNYDVNLTRKVIGTQFLPENQHLFKINFSDSSLCINNSNSIDTTGYKRIKSSFEKNTVVYIYLTIDSIEYKFLFDTGSYLTLAINKKHYKNHKNINDLILEGHFGVGVQGLISAKLIIKSNKQAVYLTNSDSIYVKYAFIDNLVRNNMGMGFISKFDWIFDFDNKVVYVKPLIDLNQNDTNQNDTNQKYFTYLVAEYKNKLKIVTRNLSAKPTIPLNSVIKSVNGVAITTENICYYLDFLNKNSDWSSFQIEFCK